MNLDNLFREISKRGLSLKKVSEETGISAGLLSEWKNGNRNPSLKTLEKIALYLDCSVDYLVGRKDKSVDLSNFFTLAKELKLSMKKISEETGIPATVLSDWKRRNSNPTAYNLIILADYLDCSVDYLIGRTDIPNMKSLYDLSRLYDVRIKLKSIEDDISAILLQK